MIGEPREGRLQKIPVGRLRVPDKPARRPPGPEEVKRLAASIRKHGLLHPLQVRPAGKSFEIVSGVRRFLACRELGMGEIPAVVRSMDERQALEIALAENARRDPLSSDERRDLVRRLTELYPGRAPEELEAWLGHEAREPSGTAVITGLQIALPDWMESAAAEESKVETVKAPEAKVRTRPWKRNLVKRWVVPLTRILLRELNSTGNLDMTFLQKIVHELCQSLGQIPPVDFLHLKYWEKPDRALPRHCVNVAKLAIFLGREFGLPSEDLEQVAVCGLLHDVGMMRVKESVLQKAGKLDEEEWKQVHGHPSEGAILLTKEHVLRDVVARVAWEHHERPNGSGYPEGKRKEEIHLFARLINVADTYEALVSPRAHRPPVLPFKAMQMVMDNGARGMLDWDLVQTFVRAMSVYPIGSYVRLEGGEAARVVRSNPGIPEKPVIAIIADAQGEPLPEPVELDLAVAEHPPFVPVAEP